jgi:hypothetical protein
VNDAGPSKNSGLDFCRRGVDWCQPGDGTDSTPTSRIRLFHRIQESKNRPEPRMISRRFQSPQNAEFPHDLVSQNLPRLTFAKPPSLSSLSCTKQRQKGGVRSTKCRLTKNTGFFTIGYLPSAGNSWLSAPEVGESPYCEASIYR